LIDFQAWQYRQYVIKTYDLWSNELEYVDSLIRRDIRNNSAWNQRYFVINNTKDTSDHETIRDEIEFCKNKIGLVVDNESVWNYLRAFLKNLTAYPKDLVDFCFDLYEKTEENHSPFLILFICDYYETQLNEMVLNNSANTDEFKSIFNKAIRLLEQLATKYDVIREKYWVFIQNKWKENYDRYLKQ
jgi:protein farnesyltransferase/geranylgeranyltransferase type-1 subunit alpha